MKDFYELRLGLEKWEIRYRKLNNEFGWKAMQDSISAYGPSKETTKWLDRALTEELENGGKTLKAITEIGKMGPRIWTPEFIGNIIVERYGGLEEYIMRGTFCDDESEYSRRLNEITEGKPIVPVFDGDGALRRMAAQDPKEVREFLSGDQYRALTRIVEAARETLREIGERPAQPTIQEKE